MNVHHIRAALRWTAGAATAGALSGAVYGLVRHDRIDHDNLWHGAFSWLIILGVWLIVETSTANTDRIIAATPKAHHIVAATLRHMEAEAAREAGLPQIADGQRTR